MSAAEARSELLKKYGYNDTGALLAGTDEYISLCRALDKAETALAAANQSFKSSEASVKESENLLFVKAHEIFPSISEIAELPAIIREAEAAAEALKNAEFTVASARNYYAAVAESFEGDPEAVDFSFMSVPMRSREDTVSALARVNTQLADEKSSFDRKSGELKSFGAPELIAGELKEIDYEIKTQTEKYESLTLALEVLAEANTDMQTRFAPIISREASAVLARLTDGRYDRLNFNRSFSAEAKSTSDSMPRSALSLSVGTVDQVYLALRLAMCRLLLSEGEKSPIVLDDVLANFDDRRALSALKLLKEIGKERQILLFTCHSRETKMLSGDNEVNIVRQ
jgi:DNA repair exonuclease SbcCD ATPase subunit